MGLQVLSDEAIAGIDAKLKRADESIQNLDSEIRAFISDGPDPARAHDKRQAAEEWWQDRLKKKVPVRFSAITGEIVHHFRSSLDHIVWDLSAVSYRTSNERDIGFPIFTEPPKQKKLSNYERKVAGIKSTAAIDLLKKLQPYNASDPEDKSLAILNDLDRVYKHRTLVLVVGSFRVDLTFHIPQPIVISALEPQSKMESSAPADEATFNFSFFIAFKQFGKRENQSIIPSLMQFGSEVRRIVDKFA